MNAYLYFVGRFKDGQLLFLTAGPFVNYEDADKALPVEMQSGRCYNSVVKTSLPFETCEY